METKTSFNSADYKWELIFDGADADNNPVACWISDDLFHYEAIGTVNGKKVRRKFFGETAWQDSRRWCGDLDSSAWSSEGWE
jgi:hypothetical protein